MSYNEQDRAVFHPRASPRTARHTSPSPAVSLTHEHISDAQQRSPDNGATLDLAHRHIADISEATVEELFVLGRSKTGESKSASLARIALGHNRLTTLPVAFSLLSRLRYLNLKSNNFTLFPDVLTAMPTLEVLDLSRNKIRRLPTQAGTLTNLRVFSLSKNKLNKLPAYMADFHKLRIFKVDQNPVDWPPKLIMEPDGDLDDSQFMEDWIQVLQHWILHNSQPSRTSSEDSTSSDRKLTTSLQAKPRLSHLSTDNQLLSISSASHSRSGSNESDNSACSAIEASLRFSDLSAITGRSPKPERPPRLNLSPLVTGISPRSPSSSSPVTYLPTPDDSVSSEEDTAKGQHADQSAYQQQQHLRNASYTGANPKRPNLLTKKSLPELRLAKPPLLRSGGSSQSYNPSPVDHRDVRSTTPSRQDSGFSEEPSSSRTATMSTTPLASPTTLERHVTVFPIEVERNSYFRRFSTLPSSTISKAIPHSLLTLVDAARGVLFAVSQVYQTLQHYTVYAIDDRLSSVLLKVLDPASNYMLQLINALDRFDATSRRTLPSPSVCRAVVESCRDTVAVFGKAMGVLALQLKVLATHDDVRYTRQMLLVLYGATAEISNSWRTIMPHIKEVEPLLRERPPPASTKHQRQASVPRAQISPPTPNPPSTPASPRPLWRSHSAQPPVETERTRMMRRHAGSFSSKDVQIGKLLPSYIDPPGSGGSGSGASTFIKVPTPRLTLRQASSQPNSASAVTGTPTFRRSWGNHSRQGSQSSLLASSATSSTSSSPSAVTKPHLHEINSSTLLDNDAIDAMQVAVDVAPMVWEVMDTIVDEIQGTKIDLPESLTNAKALTQRLTYNIRAVKEADPAADRKALRDDATVFAKTVISLCNVFKIHGATHPLPPVLRANMIALTNATEESVMLLHVSSFSPTNSLRPYSPIVNGFSSPIASLLAADAARFEDGRLGASLTRSRSALHSNSLRMASPSSRDSPRTALPSHTFKMHTRPRKGSAVDANEGHL